MWVAPGGGRPGGSPFENRTPRVHINTPWGAYCGRRHNTEASPLRNLAGGISPRWSALCGTGIAPARGGRGPGTTAATIHGDSPAGHAKAYALPSSNSCNTCSRIARITGSAAFNRSSIASALTMLAWDHARDSG